MTDSERAPQVTKEKPPEDVEWLPSARQEIKKERDAIRSHAVIAPLLAALTAYAKLMFGDGAWDPLVHGAAIGLLGAAWPCALLAGWRVRMLALGVERFRFPPFLTGLIMSAAIIALLRSANVEWNDGFYELAFMTMMASGVLVVLVMHLAMPHGHLGLRPLSVLLLTVVASFAPLGIVGFACGLYVASNVIMPAGMWVLFFTPMCIVWLYGHFALRIVERAFPRASHRSLDTVPEAFE